MIAHPPRSGLNGSYPTELGLIPRDSTPILQYPFLPCQHHKCLVWHLILALEAIPACWDESKARVVRRVPQNYHATIPRVSALEQASLDQLGADSKLLPFREDSHRCQSHSRERSLSGVDRDRAEENMANDAVIINSDKR